MSSGLRFTREPPAGGDHIYMYTGAVDAFAYSVARQPEFAPNTVGRYRNCDPLTLGYIVKRTVEFVEFVKTIAPAWPEPQYGGQFWVNGDDAWNLPRDAYFAAGAGGQNTFIVPSYDLVIVRMGHHAGGRASRESVRAAQKELMAAISPAALPRW